jgi:tape measure domain-containing protein
MVKDNASAALNRISKNLGKCIIGFMRLDQVSQTAINVGTFTNCNDTLENINRNVTRIADNMEDASYSVDDFGDNLSVANNQANNLLSTVKKVAATYLTLQSTGNVIETSDTIALAKQRLALVVREGETVEQLNKNIMASANASRAGYTDTFNQVAKLATNAGKSFDSTDQIIKFVEEFNKLGTLGGASVYESSQAMYQLTQSMAKGKLDGDELRSVMEGMPLVAQSIAKYLDTDVGTMKKMAAEGLVTAEVVRNALLGAAADTDAKFSSLGYTWAQTWEIFKNHAIQALQPVLTRINELANNKKVQSFVTSLQNSMYVVSSAILGVFDILSAVFGFIYDNWSILQPIMVAGIVLLGAYTTALIAHNVAEGAWAAIQAISNVMAYARAKALLKNVNATLLATSTEYAYAVAAAQATVAQASFNTALLACPVTWIILAIIAVIAAVYMIVAAINKLTGSTISATGIIVGAFAVAGAFIYNTVLGVLEGIIQLGWAIFVEPFIGIIEFVLNAANGGFNSFGDAVANLIGQIISWFLSLGKVVTKIIDAIFGTNWTAGLNSLQDSVLEWGKNENAITIDRSGVSLSDMGVNRISYGDAWDAGYSFGEGIDDKVGNLFSQGTEDTFEYEVPDSITDSLGNIEDNTGTTAKSVDISQEDLKYLRDIAEQEAINRFTTAKITVEMNNQNNINNDMDLDGIVDHLATRVTEAMEVAAAGAY